MVLVYTTCRDTTEGEKIGRLLVTNRLAACVKMMPVNSLYQWKGNLTASQEVMLMVETQEQQVAKIEEIIAKNQSYTVPLIAVVDVRRINREYKEWLVKAIH